jgi:hypothetical protein
MMRENNSALLLRFVSWLVVAVLILSGCGGSHEETIAGVHVPIPRGMTKSPHQGLQLTLPGFGGAQANYQGNLEPEKVVAFYKKEMPERGWQPAAGILGKGGMLSYTKEGKALVVMIGTQDGKTSLTFMIGGAPQ